MLNLLIYLIVMGATLYTATIYRGSAVVMLFLIEAVYFCTSLLFLLYQSRQIKFRLHFPLPMAEKGQEIPLQAELDNAGIFPVAKIRICLKYRIAGSRKKKKIHLFAAADARRRTSVECSLLGGESGTCLFDRAALRIYDPLRLLFVTKRISLGERLDIMPKLCEVNLLISERVRQFVGESERYDRFRSGSDASEIFQIREFQEGDLLKNVHWKLSAKGEELLVRENSRPVAPAVVVFLDFSGTGRRWNKANQNAFLTLALSISYAMLEQRCPYLAAWYSPKEQDIVRMVVDDEESFYGFVLRALEEGVQKKGTELERLYREKYKGESWIKELGVNQKLEITVQGKQTAKLHERTLEEDIKSVELVL